MISVLRPGMLTTVQDRGRWGWQHLGVTPGGPMDPFSFRAANLLVGNDEWDAALEITLIGPHLRMERDLTIALTGADLSASVDAWMPVAVGAGTVVRFGPRRALTRAYLAVKGGIRVTPVLGSRASSLSARLPGLAGRALRSGDTLPTGTPAGAVPSLPAGLPLETGDVSTVRFMWGPDRDRFNDETATTFVESVFTLSPDSNRMGYRLQGRALHVERAGEILSEASPIGSIQVPPSGHPIVLMADRQTTGGYARIGTAITADLKRLGQLGPGDAVRFQPCGREEALAALRAERALLERIKVPA